MGTFGRVVVGLIVVAVGYSLFNLATTHGPIGSEHLIGRAAPHFAAPLAGSSLVGDVNLYTHRQGKIPAACDVTEKGAFVSCRDLTGSAVLAFTTADNETCLRQIDVLNKFASDQKGKVHVAGVVMRPAVSQTEELKRVRRWTGPVVIDRDGALGAVYEVGACPTTFFLHNGKVTAVQIGLMTESQMARKLTAPGPTS